jgi:hypothetical protein
MLRVQYRSPLSNISIEMQPNFEDIPLHRLGWKAFQDLCVAIVEERTDRAVQTFLPVKDAGRDGAFVGRWDSATSRGESTIQCKFTSKADSPLRLSSLKDELPKARRLARKRLANDYIILTNHTMTGSTELKIRKAFEDVGVKRCRVFHRDWIIDRICNSSKLRMMVPRLYGLIDLSEALDERAYRQAQLILSEMGDNLQKLVVTDAHRKAVRAISKHNVVLLLGSPAAGKSTIGASLALGANDIWNCSTIKSTSPQHLEQHIDPRGNQFFWIDDAWGSTQFQADRIESWNQVFPLMQGAMKRGTRFLITSRDYIWSAAKQQLKLQAFPILRKSQVVIDVHDLTIEEKARILYNHLKLGDQAPRFRALVKDFLPKIARSNDFLPETARRLGTQLFTEHLLPFEPHVLDFFSRPMDFLEQTIGSLSAECQAGICLVFLNGGKVRSPIEPEKFSAPAQAFEAKAGQIRTQIQALDGSLLNFAKDEEGAYWTYRHPTIGDAFASHIAKSPELVEFYLRGAKPEDMVGEVVCAGVKLRGAPVIVPKSLNKLLVERIVSLRSFALSGFITQRANRDVAKMLLDARPDLRNGFSLFVSPIRDDSDVDLLLALRRMGLLKEEERLTFVESVRQAAVEKADSSFLEVQAIRNVLTQGEFTSILEEVRNGWFQNIPTFVRELRGEWDRQYSPDDYFEEFRKSVKRFSDVLLSAPMRSKVNEKLEVTLKQAVFAMYPDYDEEESTPAPRQQSAAKESSLDDLFRDVDE